jgi:hypothetical protein
MECKDTLSCYLKKVIVIQNKITKTRISDPTLNISDVFFIFKNPDPKAITRKELFSKPNKIPVIQVAPATLSTEPGLAEFTETKKT